MDRQNSDRRHQSSIQQATFNRGLTHEPISFYIVIKDSCVADKNTPVKKCWLTRPGNIKFQTTLLSL
ncbi:hypothetical protein H206_06966 [Candidatus Electrothrix aarhusensis]|uniref:Uncharacterized protein n=1 Tax=Candidatus Electrothrix aarhusensis TaxID=1859131 RepID=A0A3S3QU10_9BACT|nr:hypothetical protein H206_06966 [Candidatus Electrothrix aarhusensis]